MTKLLKNLSRWFGNRCTTSRVYRFFGHRYQVTIDWIGIIAQLRSMHDHGGAPVPVIGGLAPAFYPISFGCHYSDIDLVVINPGNPGYWWPYLKAKIFKKEWSVQILTAQLLAHELRHVMQGVHDYGRKTWWLLPSVTIGRYFLAVMAGMALCQVLNWFVPVGFFIYLRIVRQIYLNDWRERDARQYTDHNWQDWIGFVTVFSVPRP